MTVAEITCREAPYRAFSQHVDKYFERTIFTYKVYHKSKLQTNFPDPQCLTFTYQESSLTCLQCRSWFKRNEEEGRIVGLWPGSSVHAQQVLQSPRFEDFVYVQMPPIRDNILAWLGNGLTMAQNEGSNTTAYLDEVDLPPVINHGPRPAKPANQKIPLTDISASATNGLGSESKVNGIYLPQGETLVEKVVAMPA